MSTTENTPAGAAVALLASALSDGAAAREAVIVKRYGKGTTPAHVALALKVARVMAGEDKPRGGAADRINKVLASLDSSATASDYVSAARAVMEAHAAAEAKRREDAKAERAQLRATYNDRGQSVGARTEAAHALASMDYRDAADKRAAAAEGFRAAVVRALAAGIPAAELLETVSAAAPVLAIVEDVAA